MKKAEETCTRVVEQSAAGEVLSPGDRAHLADCPHCRAQVALVRSLERAGEALRREHEPRPDEVAALAASVRARIGRAPTRARLGWAAGALAVTAALVVAVVTVPRAPEEPNARAGREVPAREAVRGPRGAEAVVPATALRSDAAFVEVWESVDATPLEALLPEPYLRLSQLLRI